MHICIVGDPRDLSFAYVEWLAKRRGIQTLALSEDTLGTEWSYVFDDLAPQTGTLDVAGVRYLFSDLSGAYVRLNPRPILPPGLNLPAEEQSLFIMERRVALQHFLNSLPGTVANCPSSGRSNGSKPFQMYLLSKAGFQVPKWTVSNKEADVKAFAQECHDGAVYKACSGLRSRVRLLDEQVLDRLHQGTSPIVVQEYISGRDVRVHTIRHQAFATQAISAGVDYRFESDGNQFLPTAVPQEIEELCHCVAEREGLTIAGFDFRVTEDEVWYCLEVNPVPTFLPYEIATGQPIGDTLLDALTGSS